MKTVTRLDPPIPLETTKGKGVAHFLIDYGFEHDLIWVVFLNDNGQCWSFKNQDIRAQRNITAGRNEPETLEQHFRMEKKDILK